MSDATIRLIVTFPASLPHKQHTPILLISSENYQQQLYKSMFGRLLFFFDKSCLFDRDVHLSVLNCRDLGVKKYILDIFDQSAIFHVAIMVVNPTGAGSQYSKYRRLVAQINVLNSSTVVYYVHSYIPVTRVSEGVAPPPPHVQYCSNCSIYPAPHSCQKGSNMISFRTKRCKARNVGKC